MCLNWNVSVDPQLGNAHTAALSHRRDRRGRAQRGPMIVPGHPGWATRAEIFDDLVWSYAQYLQEVFPPSKEIEFAVEDVPPAKQVPWETGVIRLGRAFGADRQAKLGPKVVLYRLPILRRAPHGRALAELVRAVVVENLCGLYFKHPEEIDPNY